eukprot:jgi/Mesvir1/3848/Mv19813-RA.1
MATVDSLQKSLRKTLSLNFSRFHGVIIGLNFPHLDLEMVYSIAQLTILAGMPSDQLISCRVSQNLLMELEEQQIRNFLVENRLADDMSLKHFASFFPSAYRSQPEIIQLHKAFLRHFGALRHKVEANIEQRYATLPREDTQGLSLDAATAHLAAVKATLEGKLRDSEASVASSQAAIARFMREVESRFGAGGALVGPLVESDAGPPQGEQQRQLEDLVDTLAEMEAAAPLNPALIN